MVLRRAKRSDRDEAHINKHSIAKSSAARTQEVRQSYPSDTGTGTSLEAETTAEEQLPQPQTMNTHIIESGTLQQPRYKIQQM